MTGPAGEVPPCSCGKEGRRGPFHEHLCPVFLAWSHRETASTRPHQPCECERCTAYQDGWDEFGRRLAVAMRSMGYEVSPSDNGPQSAVPPC